MRRLSRPWCRLPLPDRVIPNGRISGSELQPILVPKHIGQVIHAPQEFYGVWIDGVRRVAAWSVGWLPALNPLNLPRPARFTIASTRMLRAELPVQTKSTLYLWGLMASLRSAACIVLT
jgi:hypothetical protein